MTRFSSCCVAPGTRDALTEVMRPCPCLAGQLDDMAGYWHDGKETIDPNPVPTYRIYQQSCHPNRVMIVTMEAKMLYNLPGAIDLAGFLPPRMRTTVRKAPGYTTVR